MSVCVCEIWISVCFLSPLQRKVPRKVALLLIFSRLFFVVVVALCLPFDPKEQKCKIACKHGERITNNIVTSSARAIIIARRRYRSLAGLVYRIG